MILSLSSVKHLYDGSDPVHGFSHIERVYRLCDHIGRAEGAEMEILLTAAFDKIGRNTVESDPTWILTA